MSTRAFFGIVGWGSIALGAGYAIACSSNTEATVDAGSDALSIVLPPREASVPTGDLTSPATDAGAAPDALICPPAPVDDFRPQPFHPAKAGQGLCTAAEINAFISACVTATAADCTTWLAANVSGDNPNTAFAPGGGTPCGNCILDGKANNGGLWTDPDGLFQPNYAGCFQIEDPVNGPACGAAYNNLSGCQNFACEYCTTNAGYNQCSSVIFADTRCGQYEDAAQSLCQAESSNNVYNECAGSNGGVPDYLFVLNLICGAPEADASTGPDAMTQGGVDAGRADALHDAPAPARHDGGADAHPAG